MKSLATLRRATTTAIRTRSRSCRAKLRSVNVGRVKGKQYQEVEFDVVGSTSVRRCKFRFFGKISTTALVWVSCSCEDFRYVHEVALTAAGSSSVEYSSGAIPHVKNPRGRIGLCKHLYRASDLAVAIRGGR